MAFSELLIPIVLIIVSIVGILWALFNAKAVSEINLLESNSFISYDVLSDESGSQDVDEKIKAMLAIGRKIANGADAFLTQEYSIMFIFILFFGCLVLFVVDILGKEGSGFSCYATVAYVIGSLTSMLCGWIGMKIAVASNFRTAYRAM